jgi:hypothetical protein
MLHALLEGVKALGELYEKIDRDPRVENKPKLFRLFGNCVTALLRYGGTRGIVVLMCLSVCVSWPHSALRAVLCCAVLCCAVLCCAVLCCAVLCCAVLCCAVLCCAVLCCACAVLCMCCAVHVLCLSSACRTRPC